MKVEFRTHDGESALGRRDVSIARVPMEHDVRIVEGAGACHVDLASAAFLRWCSVKADCAGQTFSF